MVQFWVFVLAVSVLLYVLLDGFDLGVGILFGFTGSEQRRRAMLAAVAILLVGLPLYRYLAEPMFKNNIN